MKYRVENQLDLFEFHDSEFSLISFDNKSIAVSVNHLDNTIKAQCAAEEVNFPVLLCCRP